MTLAFDVFLIYLLCIFLGACVVSYACGKWNSLGTFILLFAFQGLISVKYAPIAIASFGNRVSIIPEINLGMVVAIALLFLPFKDEKMGAICYLTFIGLYIIPLLFLI